MARPGPHVQFALGKRGLKKSFFRDKTPDFWSGHERERERKKKKFKLLSSIYGVLSFGIRRTKNESSSTRRRLLVGTENNGFHPRIQARSSGNQRFRVLEVSTGLPIVSSTLQEVGILPTLVYFPF